MDFTFNEAKILVTEHQHNMPGISEFTYRFKQKERSLQIFYKNILIEDFSGEQALEIFGCFNEKQEEKILPTTEVVRIAANCCMTITEGLYSKTKKEEYVFARWLVFYYMKTFSTHSLAKIGAEFSQHHSTVSYSLKEINNSKLNGWRREYKLEFENIINKIHSKIGIGCF